MCCCGCGLIVVPAKPRHAEAAKAAALADSSVIQALVVALRRWTRRRTAGT